MKWENPDKYHVTLRFLGDIDESKIEKLNTFLQKNITFCRPFETKLEELSAFPDFRKPGVIVVKLAKSEFFEKLQANVNKACGDFVKPDKHIRGFIPHVTVGRVKNKFKICGNLKQIRQKRFEISKIGIVCSELASSGSKYRNLNVLDL